MKILVTGGTGVVGSPTVAALVRRKHELRLFSRQASEAAKTWGSDVVAFEGSITDAGALARAALGCDAVVHLAGIVSEAEGAGTFEEVNVQGTRNVIAAAEQAGVRRVVCMSSLGAERGASPYHTSKRRAELFATQFSREWVILRPGNVYGPGDDVISLLLKMVRVLPAVPVIDGGHHEFQPIWVEDLAEAIGEAVERPEVVGRVLDLAGPDLTSMNDLIERFKTLTGRSPLRVPVPGFLSVFGARALTLLGLHAPLDAGQVQMLEEGSRVESEEQNALVSVFHLSPTGLDDGLRRLTDSVPELPITDGVGALVRRRVWADIVGSAFDSSGLFQIFLRRFGEITPWHLQVGAEPGTDPQPRLGRMLSMHLPLRGNVQVRVVELTDSWLTLATVEGHPLAGVIRFKVEPLDGQLRFQIEVHDRPSNLADWLVMSTVGR